MSYALVYAIDGHEISTDAPSLDAVNATIRKLYDDEGDRRVTILRIEEDHDGPRTWRIEYPPAPPAGTRVQDEQGLVLTVGEDGLIPRIGATLLWPEALRLLGPLTEVVETEVEAAARRLREAGYDTAEGHWPGGATVEDLRIVLAHVLNGGQV